MSRTDHANEARVKMGYDYDAFGEIDPSPTACYPLHEDEGTTVHDVAGSNDGTYNGPVPGQRGLLGTSAPSWANSGNDHVRVADPFDANADFTMTAWYRTSSNQRSQLLWKRDKSDFDGPLIGINQRGGRGANGYVTFSHSDGDSYAAVIDDSRDVSDGDWHMATMTWDESSKELVGYIDGDEIGTDSVDIGPTTNVDMGIGNEIFTNYAYPFGGEIAEVRTYQATLSQSQIRTLYDVVSTESTFRTATKSFDVPQTPNVVTNSSLDQGSITIDVVGSPDTPNEEVRSVSLAGGANERNSLAWSNSHADFRVRARLSTNDPTRTPVVESIRLGDPATTTPTDTTATTETPTPTQTATRTETETITATQTQTQTETPASSETTIQQDGIVLGVRRYEDYLGASLFAGPVDGSLPGMVFSAEVTADDETRQWEVGTNETIQEGEYAYVVYQAGRDIRFVTVADEDEDLFGLFPDRHEQFEVDVTAEVGERTITGTFSKANGDF